jgi:membrane-bound metal-dependent hydrolase YbcI (DUF457 family)
MDPVSHAALGLTLGAWGAGQRHARGAVTAAVCGALAPDVDAMVMPFGWDRYLRVHEVGTHSAVGMLVIAFLAATVVRRFVRGAEWRVLMLAAWAGAAGHVLLDLLSSARIRLWWPVDSRQVTIPLVAMADPWLAAILAAAFPVLWFCRRSPRRASAALLAVAAAFLVAKGVAGSIAVQRYRAGAAGAEAAVVEARWASLSEWHVFDRVGGRIRTWRIDPRSEPRIVAAWPVESATALSSRSAALSAVRNFRRVHALAFPVTTTGADGSGMVRWSDPRFCRAATDPGGGESGVYALPGPGRVECALWVGADFDAAGTPVRQVVEIFGFTQVRRPDE